MKTRNLWAVSLFLLSGTAGAASAADTVPLAETTAPWLSLLKSGDAAVRDAAGKALAEIVRKHPAAAGELVNRMSVEENAEILAEHERRLVTLAKESPATVSAFIQMMKQKGTNYRVRNFGVKVLSQVGPAVATPELINAFTETYCPVPGSFMRVLRALGKDAGPILAVGYRHPEANVRKWSTISLRVIGRNEPTIQKLFNDLQAEGGLLLKLKDGTSEERVAAIAPLAQMAHTTPGTGTLLVKFLADVTDKDAQAEGQKHLIVLGRESSEVVEALLAGVRGKNYRLRGLALKILPKVGPGLNCNATLEALADHYCPVPYLMQRILIAAGPDSLPVLSVAQKHTNPEIREAAEEILKRMPKPATAAAVTATP